MYVPGQQGCRGVDFTHVQSVHCVEGAHGLDLTQVPKPNISIGTGNVDRSTTWRGEGRDSAKGGGGGWKGG